MVDWKTTRNAEATLKGSHKMIRGVGSDRLNGIVDNNITFIVIKLYPLIQYNSHDSNENFQNEKYLVFQSCEHHILNYIKLNSIEAVAVIKMASEMDRFY